MKGKNRSLHRTAGRSVEADTIAIVCEGVKTEHLYFSGIRTTYRLSTAKLHVVGIGQDPLLVVERAVDLLSQYDHVWAVFDVEAPQPHARLRQALDLADRKGVRCAVSNPCFELWLLLHFRNQSAYLDNAAVRALLRQQPCAYGDKGFDFGTVWSGHQAAIDHAYRLHERQSANHPDVADRNPWTDVHLLVIQLLGVTGTGTGAP